MTFFVRGDSVPSIATLGTIPMLWYSGYKSKDIDKIRACVCSACTYERQRRGMVVHVLYRSLMSW